MALDVFPKLRDLLRVLTAATDRRTVHWNSTAEEDTFRTTLDFGMVQISKRPAESRYVLSLLDTEGTLLEEYEPAREEEVLIITELYTKARRQALDVDSKLKDFFSRLKSLAGES